MAPHIAPSFSSDPDDDPSSAPVGASDDAADQQFPHELAGLFPALEALAERDAPLSAPTRERIRTSLEQPLDELQTALDLVKAARAGGDPEFAASRLLELCATTYQQLLQVDEAVSRALRAPVA